MSISLADNVNLAEIKGLAEKLAGKAVALVEPIRVGGNSRLFKIIDDNGEKSVLKFYFVHPNDTRNRLQTEYQTLVLLNNQNIQNVAKPIAIDEINCCALYSWINGNVYEGSDVQAQDIEAVVDFILTVNQASVKEAANDFNPASESYFSINEILENVDSRLQRFFTGNIDESSESDLFVFLNNQFVPAWQHYKAELKAKAQEFHVVLDQEISHESRMLSPSDIGFHNMLKGDDGTSYFFDFEYFGWDDPVKFISDFLWHPGMNLSIEMKNLFLKRSMGMFKYVPQLQERLELLYPVFGFKWCLIVLNEFLKEEKQRREFASGLQDNFENIKVIQLSKAQKILTKLQDITAGV